MRMQRGRLETMILDVGSGSATYTAAQSRGEINIDIGRPKVVPDNFVQCDAHHLPFKTGVFDKAFFYDVIEHLDSPLKALKEICRVLRNDGAIELSTPNPLHWRNFLRALRNKDLLLTPVPDHITTWTDAEMRNLMIRAGFNNICISFTLLKATQEQDYGHMKYDLPLFNLSAFFRRVTGRAMIVNAVKEKTVSEDLEFRVWQEIPERVPTIAVSQ
jgi:ubiquinone/menaquinone biosynthesis C-methylase UbiE